MDRDFSRVAIVNRGEAAMRCIAAIAELNAERTGWPPLTSIALHTAAEAQAMFVREADDAVCLDDHLPVDGAGAVNPYLDVDTLLRALQAGRADAVWVGWGFVAERPAFAEACAEAGLVFVGPDADVMRRLGDKIGAKHLAEEAGVPVAAWSGGPVADVEAARAHGEHIGYPLVIKATAGGGGRGIRRVDEPGQLAEAFASARAEAQSAFGDATVFMERLVSQARHVEVQIIADQHGTVWALGVRDCSLQRRNQKVIEESHSTALSEDQARELADAAVRLAARAGYTNAGTVEFLYQPTGQTFAFLEVNTRLQVEHPVTELTTGVDIVKLQLHVARGGRLAGDAPPSNGHAMEARLNAEDPQRSFAPAPGTIRVLSLPTGPGIRVDTGVAEGDTIPPEYDSMIAKVIAWGRDRPEAIGRLHRALAQTTVIVAGGTTNKAFLLDLLDRDEVRRGDIDTGWLDRLTTSGEHLSTRGAAAALVAAAIEAADAQTDLDRAAFLTAAARGRPQVTAGGGHAVELRHGPETYRVVVERLGPTGRYRVSLDGVTNVVGLQRLGRHRGRLSLGGFVHRIVTVTHGVDQLVEVDGVAHRFSRDDGGLVRAPAAAVVVAVTVHAGDVVELGTRVAVLEAMKMEVAITAPAAGRVREVFVGANEAVPAGAPLLRIDAIEAEPEPGADSGEDSRVEGAGANGRAATGRGARIVLAAVDGEDVAALTRAMVLGYDVERVAPAALGDDDELQVLAGFADLSALTRDRRSDTDDPGETRSPREHLHTYLRSLDVDGEGLPERFRERLVRALAHYGVTTLDPTPELEDALYRIFRAQQRASSVATVVAALLRRHLDQLRDEPAGPELRDVLDRLVAATQLRQPVLGNLARSVRTRLFDQPLIERSRRRTATDMRGHLAALWGDGAASLAPAIAAAHLEQLVACPQPLIRLLAGRPPSHSGPLVEVLTRRYYKIRTLTDVRTDVVDGIEVVQARYAHRDRRVAVVATLTSRDRLAAALATIAGVAARSSEETVVVDVYLDDDVGPDADAVAVEVAPAVAAARFARPVRRVNVGALGGATVHHLTFRRPSQHADTFEEDRVFRGLHPMVARRLQLWRLSNFTITRLPSAEDTYLFDCTARANPTDERLIAVAEVRDLTEVRDQSGRVVALPQLEDVLVTCLDNIRRAQADHPGRPRMSWNRVMLFVWPAVDTPLDELLGVASTLAPLTDGLGLEQVAIQGRFRPTAGADQRDGVVRLGHEPGRGLVVRITEVPTEPMQPLDDYTQRLLSARRRGSVYPYELIGLLKGPDGAFVEHDLGPGGNLVPVDRPAGGNTAGVVVGVVRTPTVVHPEGMCRVAILGDPTKAMGAITEAECRRILAAIDLAAELAVPIEWFALSAGAKIAMDSGSENLDWVGRVLRRLVEHTQAGHEVNVVVAGINVGAQPYWNAEATMLMHDRGILVMTPESAMVLTGKAALDYSGGISAEDNFGIGGHDRIMGPNGEAQYWAPDIAAACDVLFDHYRYGYVAPGERFPRALPTTDPVQRDVRDAPHRVDGSDFATVGDIFSPATNPDRKKPFDIRTLMRAVIDADHEPLERWAAMRDAETAVVFDAALGGRPLTLVGIESRPLPRHGLVPADGPDSWSAGTLFPLSSKKVARAINGASGVRPVVVLANLSGFDGSPESLRRLQLEYGAEIGRAIVNFDGPIVLCVVSRYHGGAFVVFSATLNDDMEVLAVEGSFASVIGGAPAAAVVFTGDVNSRTEADPRVRELQAAIAAAPEAERAALRTTLAEVVGTVRAEKLGEVAADFDAVHTVERAMAVGSVHHIIPAAELRPALISAVERGIAKASGAADIVLR